jgi:hypothetical protein
LEEEGADAFSKSVDRMGHPFPAMD